MNLSADRKNALRLAGVVTAIAAVVFGLTTLLLDLSANMSPRHLIANIFVVTAQTLAAGGMLFIFLTRMFQKQSLISERLHESEERFRQAVGHFPYGVTIYDPDLRIRYLNNFARRLYEKEFDEIVGGADANLLAATDGERITKLLRDVKSSLKPTSTELDFERNGATIAQLFTFSPTFNADGELREIISVQMDMTAFKMMGKHVRAADRSLNTLLSVNRALAGAETEPALLQGFCRALVEHGGFRSAVIGFPVAGDRFMPRYAAWGWMPKINEQQYEPGHWNPEDLSPCRAFSEGNWVLSGPDCGQGEFFTWEKEQADHAETEHVCLPIKLFGAVYCSIRLVYTTRLGIATDSSDTLEQLTDGISFALQAVNDRKALAVERTNLAESTKRLRCLLEIQGRLHENEMVSAADLEFIVRQIPTAFSIPAKTCARLTLNGNQHLSNDFAESAHRLQMDLGKEADPFGSIEVFVTAEGNDPFRPEETQLLYSVATMLEAAVASEQATAQNARLQDLFTTTFEKTAAGIAHVSTEGAFLRVNRRFAEIAGWPAAELVGMKFATITHPDDLAADMSRVAALLADKIPHYSLAKRYIAKNGKAVWINLSVALVKNSEGKPDYFISVIEDLTEVLKLQEEVRASRDELTLATESVGVGVFEWYPMEDKINWSRKAATIFGMSPENDATTAARTWLDRYQDEKPGQTISNLDNYRTDAVVTCAGKIRTPTGQTRYVRTSAKAVELNEKGPVKIVGVHQDITTEHETNELLKLQQQTFESVFNATPIGIAVFDAVWDSDANIVDFRWRLANEAAEAVTRRSTKELLGNSLLTEMPGVRETGQFEAFVQVVTTDEPFRKELYYNHEKTDAWLRVEASKLEDGLIVTFTDITDLKHSEASIQESEKRFHSLFNASPDGIVIVNLEGAFLEMNPIAAKMLGCRQEDFVGRSVFELDPVAARDPAATKAMWRDLHENGKTITFETLHQRDDGSQYPAEVNLAGFEYEGEPAIIGIFRDITERQKSQEQMRLQTSALEAAANTVVITDKDANIVWANPAFTRSSGYSVEEAIGKNPRILQSGRQDASYYKELWDTLKQGKTWRGSFVNRRKDGSEYHEDVTITPIRNEQGDVTHYVAIKEDVTEKHSLEEQFRRAQRMESIGLLAGGIAHDLNNVLAPILMAVEMLRLDAPKEEADEVLQSLENSVQRGAGIIRQVLTFARGSEGEKSLLQARHLLKEIVKIAKETFPRNIVTTANIPSNLWPIVGDPSQIHQILLNLAVNARDAMPEGGTLAFEVRNEELEQPRSFLNLECAAGPYIRIEVRDTGGGMPPEVQEKIFEPFFTTKEKGKGTGLGLPTVLGIVKSHKGLIEVISEKGAGTTFVIWLPAMPGKATLGASAATAPLPQGRGQTILIVDDEVAIISLTTKILKNNGYQVETAPDGTQAIAKVAEDRSRYDAVITDIMMPYMDGVALTRSLRQLNAKMPIIVVSGMMDSDIAKDRTAELKQLGVKTILPKPCRMRDLLESLADQLPD